MVKLVRRRGVRGDGLPARPRHQPAGHGGLRGAHRSHRAGGAPARDRPRRLTRRSADPGRAEDRDDGVGGLRAAPAGAAGRRAPRRAPARARAAPPTSRSAASGATGSGAPVARTAASARNSDAGEVVVGLRRAGRRGRGPGGRLGGAHQRQRQPLGLDLDQRDGAQRGQDQVLGVDPQRRLPAPAADDVGQVGLVLADVVGQLRPRRRAGCCGPARPRARRSRGRRGAAPPRRTGAACRTPSAPTALSASWKLPGRASPRSSRPSSSSPSGRSFAARSPTVVPGGDDPAGGAQVVRLVGHARPPRRRSRRSAPRPAPAAPRG